MLQRRPTPPTRTENSGEVHHTSRYAPTAQVRAESRHLIDPSPRFLLNPESHSRGPHRAGTHVTLALHGPREPSVAAPDELALS